MGSNSKDGLQKAGITHVLSVCGGHPPKFPSFFTYKVVSVLDTEKQNLKKHFKECIDFIKEAIDYEGGMGRVFVHCFAGVSRSATIVASYLIQEHGMTLAEAMSYIKTKRPFVNPNSGFRKQLFAF